MASAASAICSSGVVMRALSTPTATKPKRISAAVQGNMRRRSVSAGCINDASLNSTQTCQGVPGNRERCAQVARSPSVGKADRPGAGRHGGRTINWSRQIRPQIARRIPELQDGAAADQPPDKRDTGRRSERTFHRQEAPASAGLSGRRGDHCGDAVRDTPVVQKERSQAFGGCLGSVGPVGRPLDDDVVAGQTRRCRAAARTEPEFALLIPLACRPEDEQRGLRGLPGEDKSGERLHLQPGAGFLPRGP